MELRKEEARKDTKETVRDGTQTPDHLIHVGKEHALYKYKVQHPAQ